MMVNNNLVGDFNHLEKYEFVNGKDDIPYMMENSKKCLKPPTSQYMEKIIHSCSKPPTREK